VGAWLARSQGIQAMTRLQMELSRGGLPGKALMDGAAILIGGTLLLTPGVLTDLLGFALLVPQTRALFRSWASKQLARRLKSGRIQVVNMGMWGGGTPRTPADSDPGRESGNGRGDDEDPPRPPRPGEIVQ
jgi:UPF0716 protein FxsA